MISLPSPAPTPRDVIARDGTAALYRFVPPAGAHRRGPPVVIVPSMINRWYVVDLRRGASLCEALVAAGLDAWCVDWGVPEDEDRYLTWDDIALRLARLIRRARREAGADRVALLGYCMGGTLAAIHAALHPDDVRALVDLAGPIDFAAAGRLRHLVDPAWFDASAIAAAGNVSGARMQAGFVALRPTLGLAKLAALPDVLSDPPARDAFLALEAWTADNVAFPGAAYETYVRELYQENRLVHGTHRVRGRAVRLGAIRCPTLVIVADRDEICPPPSAIALCDHVATDDTTVLRVAGGHVGAVVGRRAASEMFPALIRWLAARVCERSGP